MKNGIVKIGMFFLLVMVLGCSNDDTTASCTPIACLNGGVSTADCGCDCPQGFTGTNCGTQVIPTQIKITKIRVKKFPNLKPNNSKWDSFVLPGYENPDIFPALLPFEGTSVLFVGTPINDSFSYGNDSFDFIPTTPIVITQLSQQFTLILYDDDSTTLYPNTFEQMGGFNFYIYSSTGGFPTTMPLNSPTSSYGFELTLSYIW